MYISQGVILLFIALWVLTGYVFYKVGRERGWAAGIGDAAEEYAKGYNLGVLETIKKLSEEE